MKKQRVRDITVENGVATLELTKGYFTQVDASDLPKISGKLFYAEDGKFPLVYAVYSNKRYGIIRLHRLILGAKKGEVVDHIDGDGLNNKRANLRLVMPHQNSSNCKMPTSNSSGYKGVYWCRQTRKWKAQIQHCRKKIGLGYFTTPRAAYDAYCAASHAFHGKFGRTI